jgi:aminotransferase EvaB
MSNSEIRVPFNSPAKKFAEDHGLSDALDRLISTGPYFHGEHEKNFESQLARLVGQASTVMVSSGTSALVLALASLELDPLSEVLITANAGGYSSIACVRNGLIPRYVDVDPFGQMDFYRFKDMVDAKTRAVIVTHLYGQINKDIEAFRIFCDKWRIALIEDCAQTLGASLNSQPSGSFSTLSTFSFYPTKNLGTIGDAGAVATSNPLLVKKLLSIREYGWVNRYEIVNHGGSNFRSDELHALVLNRQLERLSEKNKTRKNIWHKYKNAINQNGISILGSHDESFVAHLAVLKCKTRKRFMSFMNERGIETSIHYPIPDNKQIVFSEYDNEVLQNTMSLSEEVVSIPLFPELTEQQISLVVNAIEDYQKLTYV